MNIEKTLERLKKIHEQYSKNVAVLADKISILQKELDDAKTKQIQTFDAIQALEGKPTISKMLESMARPANPVNPAIYQDVSVPSDLPAPEPGMKYVQNNLKEWVLIPIDPPKPLFVPGVFSGTPDDDLPKVDEEFEDPSTFL